ncbi:MAG TPA: TetR family transcriptional regulator [Solirubrobacteraceae bacterium]|nr:TetR family transcriptional regulator [Solirubrobacteraceae bacterium]
MSEVQGGRLLAAAVEVVSEAGYSGMSMARVTGRAGVSRGTFYELFEDREDCFLAAFDDAVARIASVAAPAYERERSWGEKVRAGLTSVLQCIGDEPGLGSLLVVDALSAGPRVLERRARWLERLTGIVDQGRLEVKGSRELPPLTAEGVVGAVLSVLFARLLEHDDQPLVGLLNELMAVIVLPYLGPAAARKELECLAPRARCAPSRLVGFPLDDLDIRITYRTLRVLAVVAEQPGISNRGVADAAGISDQGQISKLLARLRKLGLIENSGAGQAKGMPNSWALTARGAEVQEGIDLQAGHARH